MRFNDYEVLTNAGTVSAEVAKNLAAAEYEKYRVIQDREYESDFDKEVKKTLKSVKKKDKPQDQDS